MDERDAALGMISLSVNEVIDTLYEELTVCLNDTHEILAIVSEPGLKDSTKTRLTVVFIPNRSLCSAMLFSDNSMRIPQWSSESMVTSSGSVNMTSILSVLTKNCLSGENLLKSIRSENYSKLLSSEIESVSTRSLLSIAPYGVQELAGYPFLLNLLFSPSTVFYNSSFKKFIQFNRFSLIPDKSGLIFLLNRDFTQIISDSSSNSFCTNSSVRDAVFASTYSLFTLFMLIQRFIFSGFFTLELDEKQELLLSIIKTSASPFPYIKDAIDVLKQQRDVDVKSTALTNYNIAFRNSLITYVSAHLESSKTQLLGEIKL